MDLKGKYGLIIPAKEREAKATAKASNPPPPRKRNVFGDVESDSDEADEDTDWVKKTMKKQSHGSIQQKQSIQAIKKALADDPTVYEYDALYDDMEKKRENSKDAAKKNRNPKYIENLLKTAEKRKQEEEARNERLVQKERENEGDMYKDKEAFVTGAYRKKMEELERIKEEERRRDQLDALVDVTKQKDLSGFYRHLYRQQVDEPEAKLQEGVVTSTEDAGVSGDAVNDLKLEPDSPSREEITEPVQIPERNPSPAIKKDDPELRPRSDRKRSRSPKREREENRRVDKHKRRSRSRSHEREVDKRKDDRYWDRETRDSYRPRRDCDRRQERTDHDRRRDRSRSRDRERRRNRSRERDTDRRRERDRGDDWRSDRDKDKDRRSRNDKESDRKDRHIPKSTHSPEVVEKKVQFAANESDGDVKLEVKVLKTENTEEPTPSIWTKRTVGAVFDEALAKYFLRKQANTLQASIINHD